MLSTAAAGVLVVLFHSLFSVTQATSCSPFDPRCSREEICSSVKSDAIVFKDQVNCELQNGKPVTKHALCSTLVELHNLQNGDHLGGLTLRESDCIDALSSGEKYTTKEQLQEWSGTHCGTLVVNQKAFLDEFEYSNVEERIFPPAIPVRPLQESIFPPAPYGVTYRSKSSYFTRQGATQEIPCFGHIDAGPDVSCFASLFNKRISQLVGYKFSVCLDNPYSFICD